jgi:transposase
MGTLLFSGGGVIALSFRTRTRTRTRICTTGKIAQKKKLQQMSFRAWDSWNRGGQCKSYIFFPLPIMNTNFMAFTKRTYTAEHVKTALRVYQSVRSFRMASTRTGIPKSTIHRWTCRLGRVIERNRTRKTWKSTKRRNARFESCCKLLDDLLRDGPFKTLKDMQWALQVRNVFVSISTVHRFIRTLNYTYQKIAWRKPPRDVSNEKETFWR